MESGDLAGVWRELARSDDGDRLLFSLLALLAREWRLLWEILAGEEPRLHPSDASFKRALAQRLGTAGLAQGFAALADAEWQVKSGRRSPSQSLESLAAAMTALCAPPRRDHSRSLGDRSMRPQRRLGILCRGSLWSG